MPNIKNIIIFLAIGSIFVLIYVYFIKGTPETATLVSTSTDKASSASAPAMENNSAMAKDFLALLLSVKSIKLDDSIFSDNAFINISKHDSSIILTPDGNEGRPNPFAPFGVDAVVVTAPPICVLPKVLNTLTNTCITPPPTCISPKVLNTLTNTCVNPPSN
mgnify:CR=1